MTRTCTVCGHPFERPWGSSQQICSAECRAIRLRQHATSPRKRAYKKAYNAQFKSVRKK